MSELTCRDCKYWCFIWGSEGFCMNKKNSQNKCFAEDNICPFFADQDGKRPRFCRLASRVDDMADAMIHFMPIEGVWIFWSGYNFSDFYKTKAEAIAAAKAWLMKMEVVNERG